ncbi:hypothetical protein [Actinomyces bowdenii]|uniref:Uncharacterized protein n=1 Tax=Actinomyces bowdenii TaxID=131109 RepID=A0A3P1UP38_9ACTO|nr:hypothetical protein [Actinomyces bowdenii]RRD23358.1 hypothetical protein EII10_12040 [Actinomyces bowdenii]
MTNERLAKQVQEQFAVLKEGIKEVKKITNVRKRNRTLIDVIEDLRLDHNKRFDKVQASQDQLQAQISSVRADISDLRHELFHEAGSRETVDDSIYEVMRQNYRELNQRLKRLEEAATPAAASVTRAT